jgi:hypothetical protein
MRKNIPFVIQILSFLFLSRFRQLFLNIFLRFLLRVVFIARLLLFWRIISSLVESVGFVVGRARLVRLVSLDFKVIIGEVIGSAFVACILFLFCTVVVLLFVGVVLRLISRIICVIRVVRRILISIWIFLIGEFVVRFLWSIGLIL